MAQTDGAAAAAREARLALEALLHDVPHLTSAVTTAQADAMERYVALLLDANSHLNLTRVTEPAEVARQHLLDALAALPLLDATGAEWVIDLGSGGGVPGVPLAIVRPTVHWTLVDSIAKKATALRDIVDELDLGNVEVLAERAEFLGRSPAHRERFGAATARACAPLNVLVELALPLVAVGGELIAWKGPLTDEDDEVRRGRAASGQVGGGHVRILASGVAALGGHTFVVVPKAGPTPPRFPRRPGEPSRRPLG